MDGFTLKEGKKKVLDAGGNDAFALLPTDVSKSSAKCHGTSRLVKGDPPIGRLWLLSGW